MINPYKILNLKLNADNIQISRAVFSALNEKVYTPKQILDAQKQLLDPNKRLMANFLYPAKIKRKALKYIDIDKLNIKKAKYEELNENAFDSTKQSKYYVLSRLNQYTENPELTEEIKNFLNNNFKDVNNLTKGLLLQSEYVKHKDNLIVLSRLLIKDKKVYNEESLMTLIDAITIKNLTPFKINYVQGSDIYNYLKSKGYL